MNEHAFPLPLRRWFWLQALLILGLLVSLVPAGANDRGPEPGDRDPPSRVARVAELQGQAWWYDADEREWQPLLRNQTLAEGDRIRVEDRARVGLRIGAQALWLDERSQLEIRRLDERRIDLDLEQGALALRWVTREAAQDAQVRTREGRFSFERAGAYRIDQLQRASRGQAHEGRLRFDHRGEDNAPLLLEAPEQAELWWEQGPRAERGRLSRQDAFGDWLVASVGFGRGEALAWRESPAYRYVSPELTGAEELDRFGRWETSAEFGPLWFPLRVEVDWAPFRHGRWIWTRHWGWTWVDDLPWGYATSHYGRWVHWRGRWCWTPGSVIVHRPVFAPALVAWVGHGNVQVGIGIGGRAVPPVAWVPLAPYETYRPWFRHSPGYVRRIDPDPPTVRRPVVGWGGDNRSVPGAVSTLGRVVSHAGTVGAVRPVPLRDLGEGRVLNPLPQAPGRQWVRDAAQAPGLPVVQGQPVPGAVPTRPFDGDSPRQRAGGSQGPNGALRELPLREPMAREHGGRDREPAFEPSREAPRFPHSQTLPVPAPQVPAPVQPPVQAPVESRRDLPWRHEGARPEIAPREDEPRRAPAWSEPPRGGDRVEPRADRFERPRREPGDERQPAWRAMPRAEVPRQEAPRQEAPPAPRMPEMPMRRIEVPRAEMPRHEAPRSEPRRAKDDDNGPRKPLQ